MIEINQQRRIAGQIAMFFAQELWIVAEARRLLRSRASAKRTRAFRELSVKANSLVRDYDRFKQRFELPA